jgi:hypothetical protein
LITFYLVYQLWRINFKSASVWLAWLPILFFFLFSLNVKYYQLNYLEPISAAFTLCSVIALVQSHQRDHLWDGYSLVLLFVAAVGLTLGFLINGPLALFVLSVDLALFIAYRKYAFISYLLRTGLLLFLFMLCLSVFFLLYPGAFHNFVHYLQIQLLPALKGQRSLSIHLGWHRFDIVFFWLVNAYIPILLVIVACFMPTIKWFKNPLLTFYGLLIVFSLLPMTLSSKQFGHYSLHTNLYGMLFLAALYTEFVDQKLAKLRTFGHIVLTYVGVAFMALFFVLVLARVYLLTLVFNNPPSEFYAHPFRRDLKESVYFAAAKKIHEDMGHHKIMSFLIAPVDKNPYALEAVMQRFYGISWDPKPGAAYLLNFMSMKPQSVPGYVRIPFIIQPPYLFKKIHIKT